MNNNDILRRIRYTFDFDDDQMMEVFALGGSPVSRPEVCNWLKKEDDEEFQTLNDPQLAVFLTGFIVLRRGKKDGETPKPEKKLNNNLIFRKLKIALDLKDEDILQMLNAVDFRFGKHELTALFRNPTQPQYRPCKDQVLRNFLHGMQVTYHKEQ